MDAKTNRAWEIAVKRGEVPTFQQLTDFLAQHCMALEALLCTTRSSTSASNPDTHNQSKSTVANTATTSHKYAYCGKEDYAIY